MIIRFSKYHGAGNDFILIDNRSFVLRNSENSIELIAHLCHRRFGIGADGLILVNTSRDADFEMVFFNSDGREGSMCGNGGRCCVAFASSMGLIKDKTFFKTIDGLHEAIILKKEINTTYINLKMQDVKDIQKHDVNFIINTGSPHYVCFSKNVAELDICKKGREIRYGNMFEKEGINVNFAEVSNNGLFVRTYERGVEDETLSCGTGAVASAIAAKLSEKCEKNDGCCIINTLGGKLTVRFNKISEFEFNDIWLEGPAVCVYKGEINI